MSRSTSSALPSRGAGTRKPDPVELGVLLTLPVESIAVRAVLASAVGVVLLRGLLRLGLRSLGARVAVAAVPTVTLVTVGAWAASRGGWQLPSLMLPADAVDALPIPVTDGYVHFAPSAWPLILGVWVAVAGVLVTRRLWALHRTHTAGVAAADGDVPPSLVATVARLAAAHRVSVPRVVVATTCAGGAYVTGMRAPVLVIGRDLLDRLDEAELEGVVAHELAHVRRRDNLVATVLGTVRDLSFFVPGGRWALAQLHRERELAADQAAVAVTGRPGALASGLLKSLDRPDPVHPCAAFAPSHSLVDRVTALVDDAPPVSRRRRSSELALVAGVALVAVAAATTVPAALAGSERERDALAVAWTPPGSPEPDGATLPAAEPRAFAVYRQTRLLTDAAPAAAHRGPDTSSADDRPSTWRACATSAAACPDGDAPGVGLGLRPQPTITLDERPPWQATPAFPGPNGPTDGLGLPTVYWLQRVG